MEIKNSFLTIQTTTAATTTTKNEQSFAIFINKNNEIAFGERGRDTLLKKKRFSLGLRIVYTLFYIQYDLRN